MDFIAVCRGLLMGSRKTAEVSLGNHPPDSIRCLCILCVDWEQCNNLPSIYIIIIPIIYNRHKIAQATDPPKKIEPLSPPSATPCEGQAFRLQTLLEYLLVTASSRSLIM
jgi:hypothetical protein